MNRLIACFCLLLAASALIPGRYITHLEAHPQLLLHIGLALMAYSVGLLGIILVKILAPGFYAQQDTRTPVRVGLMAVAANAF